MKNNVMRFAAVVSIALCCGEALAGRELSRNPPSACSGPGNKCGCPEKKVTAKCIKATVDLGETTPWTGSLECSLKIFADDDSPSIFTADSLYAVLGGILVELVQCVVCIQIILNLGVVLELGQL